MSEFISFPIPRTVLAGATVAASTEFDLGGTYRNFTVAAAGQPVWMQLSVATPATAATAGTANEILIPANTTRGFNSGANRYITLIQHAATAVVSVEVY